VIPVRRSSRTDEPKNDENRRVHKMTAVDMTNYRKILGHFPTGIVLVAGVEEDGNPVGMVVGSFTSVSLDPPLVAFLPDRNSTTFSRLRHCENFVVNVLASDQEDVCRLFASKTVVDKWGGISWTPASSGAPILDDAVAWIECRRGEIREAGDHYIVLGHVQRLDASRDTLPLVFFRGDYELAKTHVNSGVAPLV
jgi:flavin reductase (DIM6/NTAB) family NADH-FMN oxidoreductase RutF